MQRQQLSQKIQQRISPQQIQYIRLLELPFLEMEDRVKQELEENPALEEGVEAPDGDGDDGDFDMDDSEYDDDSYTDISLGDYRSEDDIPDYKLSEINNRADRREEMPFSLGQTLTDYLLEQLGLRELSERDRKIGEYIIGNLDDDGYLRRDLRAITDDLIFKAGINVTEADIKPILSVIRDFDPTGIAAHDLRECLLLQLKKKTQTTNVKLVTEIITYNYDAFVRKHYDKILNRLNISEEKLKEILPVITSLNPKPGGSWSNASDMTMHQVTPDFIVEANNDELTLTLNQRGIPDLHISRDYNDMLHDYTGNKANQTSEMRDAILFVKQKLDAAQWFIDAVKQRQETLQRTMEAIVRLQTDFFLTGDESLLRPMILKDVAERAGYDISTLSRAGHGKYVQTNFGIYPLKFFFSESTQNDSGDEISTRQVKQILLETIEAEDKRKPVNDDTLAALLKEKGYVVARRTIAKYREQMGIPVARMRKEL
ncbi:MAG: RNA polymerase factor sigma-54 [Tannerella sp.]|nr:RNA polymerase factor sigma-54 [Tannerella sp.]